MAHKLWDAVQRMPKRKCDRCCVEHRVGPRPETTGPRVNRAEMYRCEVPGCGRAYWEVIIPKKSTPQRHGETVILGTDI